MKDNIGMKNLQRRVRLTQTLLAAALLALVLPVLAACSSGDPTLTVYSGRFDSLVCASGVFILGPDWHRGECDL